MDVVLALLAAVLFAAYSVAIRVGQRRAPDAQAGAMATLLVAAAVAVGVAALAAPEAPDVGALWPFTAAGVVVPGVSILIYQRSIQLAGASRPAVVIGTAPLLSVLLAAALLDEPLEAAVLAGTTLVVLGAVVLAGERTRPAHVRVLGLVLAAVCAVLFALRDNVVRAVVRDVDVPSLHAGAASLVGGAAAIALYLALRRRGRPREVRRALRPMVPTGIAFASAYLVLVSAYDAGPVTTVAPLAGTQPLWTVAIAAVVLGRSEAVGSRLVAAAALVVVGGGLIGLSR
ncbi:MAG TPA: EamA family transporter [Gaiellaceae bacterium]|nr:EamA family transporter [Gaiellaceae bacterium]